MTKREEETRLLDELREFLPKVIPALRLLQRATGKLRICDMDPLTERRWEDAHWEAYTTIVAVKEMLEWGRPWSDLENEIIRAITPANGWVGSVPIQEFAPSARMTKRMERLFPDLREKWKKTSASDLGEPRDPKRGA